MVPISLRMQKIADMVKSQSVADIGCDHGFVAIYLVLEKGLKKAVAMDINEGPLMRAAEHVEAYKLNDRISIRQSDGAKELIKGEVDSAIIAGMGARLTVKILEESEDKFRSMENLVLSPHAEPHLVRQYLKDNGYMIIDEDMVYDEGKYYTIISTRYSKDFSQDYDEWELEYGPVLIKTGHPVLREYLDYKLNKQNEIRDRLLEQNARNDERIANRLYEVDKEIAKIGELKIRLQG